MTTDDSKYWKQNKYMLWDRNLHIDGLFQILY